MIWTSFSARELLALALAVSLAACGGGSDTPAAETPTDPAPALGDPLLAQQWHLFNTGQSGGTPGSDVGLGGLSERGAGIKVPEDDLNSDMHAKADYRSHLITVMAKRAVEKVLK